MPISVIRSGPRPQQQPPTTGWPAAAWLLDMTVARGEEQGNDRRGDPDEPPSASSE